MSHRVLNHIVVLVALNLLAGCANTAEDQTDSSGDAVTNASSDAGASDSAKCHGSSVGGVVYGSIVDENDASVDGPIKMRIGGFAKNSFTNRGSYAFTTGYSGHGVFSLLVDPSQGTAVDVDVYLGCDEPTRYDLRLVHAPDGTPKLERN